MWDQHFGISGFGVSGFQIPNNNTQQLPEFRKVKGCGTNTSGFQDSGFRVFKYQTTIHNNSRIPKSERMWDQHFGISGFKVSGFQKSTSNIQQLLNCEKDRKVGPTLRGFGVWKSKGTSHKCNQQVPNAEIHIIFITLRFLPCIGILTFVL
jgi:hypothetical protein